MDGVLIVALSISGEKEREVVQFVVLVVTDDYIKAFRERLKIGWYALPCLPPHDDRVLPFFRRSGRDPSKIGHLFRQPPWKFTMLTDTICFRGGNDDRKM